MKTLIAAALCVTLPLAAAKQENHFNIVYDGGSLSDVKAGKGLKIFVHEDEIRIAKDSDDKKGEPPLLALLPKSVTEISYGQDVHRRVGAAIGLAFVSFGLGALMALAKSKKHFVGITWDDGTGKKGGIAFQASKGDYRGLLAGLEGVTGKKAVNSDALTVKN